MEFAQQQFQLRDSQRGRRAAAEINCRWKDQGAAVSSPPGRSGDRPSLVLFQLAQYRFTESPRLRTVEQILVKSAVRADARAERNVNVQMMNCCRVRCLSRFRIAPLAASALRQRTLQQITDHLGFSASLSIGTKRTGKVTLSLSWPFFFSSR